MKLTQDHFKGAVHMVERLTTEEIEKKLGLDKVEPIHLTPSDEADLKEKSEEIEEWYEDELKEYFQRTLGESQKRGD